MIRKRRRDANHTAVVAAYLGAGCSVCDLALAGEGKPDLVVGIDGRVNDLVEIKNPAGRNRVEANQQQFATDWRGRKPLVVRTPDEARAHVRTVRDSLSEGG